MSKAEELARIIAMRDLPKRHRGSHGLRPDEALITFVLGNRDLIAAALKEYEEKHRE